MATTSQDPGSFSYDAFISYRHGDEDAYIAERLHRLLEAFRTPRKLVKQGIPVRLRRVFRDREELPTSSDLSESILEALKSSRFLIVICSPRSFGSKWVAKEIEVFRSLGRGAQILTLLIDGEPAQAFPPVLIERRLVQIVDGAGGKHEVEQLSEPLAADIRALTRHDRTRLLNTELLRLLAPILGCKFDDLRQRFQERVRKRLIIAISIASVLALTFAGLAGTSTKMYFEAERQRAEAARQRGFAEANAARAVKERDSALLTDSRRLLDLASKELSENRETSALLALEGLPGADVGEERPYLPELESVLFDALGGLHEVMFAPNGVLSLDRRQLFAISPQGAVSAYDTVTGTKRFELKQAREIKAVVSTNRGVLITPIYEEGELIVWNAETGEFVRSFATGNRIKSARFHGPMNLIVCEMESGDIETWTIEGALKQRFGSKAKLVSYQFAPTGDRLAATYDDGVAHLFDTNSGAEVGAIVNSPSSRFYPRFSPNGSLLLLASARAEPGILIDAISGRVKGRVENASHISTFEGNAFIVTSTLSTGGALEAARFGAYNVVTGRFVSETSPLLSSDKYNLVMRGEKHVQVWSAETGGLLGELTYDGEYKPKAAFVGSDRVVLFAENAAQVWDIGKMEKIAELQLPEKIGGEVVGSIEASKSGGLLVAALGRPDHLYGWRIPDTTIDKFGEIREVKIESPVRMIEFKQKVELIRSIVISEDEQTVIATSRDGTAWWKSATGDLVGWTHYSSDEVFMGPDQSTFISARRRPDGAKQQLVVRLSSPSQFAVNGSSIVAVRSDPSTGGLTALLEKDDVLSTIVPESNSSAISIGCGPVAIPKVATSARSSLIAVVDRFSPKLCVMNYSSGRGFRIRSEALTDTSELAVSSDGKFIASLSDGGSAVAIWSVQTEEIVSAVTLDQSVGSLSLFAFSSDGTRLILQGRRAGAEVLKVLDTRSLAVIFDRENEYMRPYPMPDAAGGTPEEYLAVANGTDYGTAALELIKLADGTLHSKLGDVGIPSAAAWSRDGKYFSAYFGRKLTVWNAAERSVVFTSPLFDDLSIHSIFFDKSAENVGISVARGSNASGGIIFKIATGELTTIEQPRRFMDGAIGSFSDDGRSLALSRRGEVSVVDLASGREKAHRSYEGTSVKFAEGSNSWLVGESDTGPLIRLHSSTAELVKEARLRVRRCLFSGERADFFLSAKPPRWCVELSKWPYDTEEWRSWLEGERSGQTPKSLPNEERREYPGFR